jgi:hypothetical protein
VGDIQLSLETRSPVPCKALQSLPTKPTSNDFFAKCDLNLREDSARKGVRICFGANDVNTSNGPMAYAASLIDMIVNPAYAPPINKPSPYDYNWNPVTPNGCRDVIGSAGPGMPAASNISFMIGPYIGSGSPPWVPDQVTSVSATVYSIYWDEQ